MVKHECSVVIYAGCIGNFNSVECKREDTVVLWSSAPVGGIVVFYEFVVSVLFITKQKGIKKGFQ